MNSYNVEFIHYWKDAQKSWNGQNNYNITWFLKSRDCARAFNLITVSASLKILCAEFCRSAWRQNTTFGESLSLYQFYMPLTSRDIDCNRKKRDRDTCQPISDEWVEVRENLWEALKMSKENSFLRNFWGPEANRKFNFKAVQGKHWNSRITSVLINLVVVKLSTYL